MPRSETVDPGDDDEDDEDDDGKGDGTGNIDPDADEGYDDEDEDDDDEEPLWAEFRVSIVLLHRTIPGFPRRWHGDNPQRTRYRVRFPSRTRHTARPGY